MLVLTTLFCMLLIQLDLGIACVHSVQRLAMSFAVMHNVRLYRTHARLAVYAAKGNSKIAAESVIYLKQRCTL